MAQRNTVTRPDTLEEGPWEYGRDQHRVRVPPGHCLVTGKEATLMSLPKEIGSHHTMWFTVGDHHPVAVRYAVDNDEVVCFGDKGLRDLIEGSTVTGTVHDIAGGPPLLATSFDVRVLVSADVALGTIGEVIGHVSPTGTWEEARLERRLLGLRLHGSPRAA